MNFKQISRIPRAYRLEKESLLGRNPKPYDLESAWAIKRKNQLERWTDTLILNGERTDGWWYDRKRLAGLYSTSANPMPRFDCACSLGIFEFNFELVGNHYYSTSIIKNRLTASEYMPIHEMKYMTLDQRRSLRDDWFRWMNRDARYSYKRENTSYSFKGEHVTRIYKSEIDQYEETASMSSYEFQIWLANEFKSERLELPRELKAMISQVSLENFKKNALALLQKNHFEKFNEDKSYENIVKHLTFDQREAFGLLTDDELKTLSKKELSLYRLLFEDGKFLDKLPGEERNPMSWRGYVPLVRTAREKYLYPEFCFAGG